MSKDHYTASNFEHNKIKQQLDERKKYALKNLLKLSNMWTSYTMGFSIKSVNSDWQKSEDLHRLSSTLFNPSRDQIGAKS